MAWGRALGGLEETQADLLEGKKAASGVQTSQESVRSHRFEGHSKVSVPLKGRMEAFQLLFHTPVTTTAKATPG